MIRPRAKREDESPRRADRQPIYRDPIYLQLFRQSNKTPLKGILPACFRQAGLQFKCTLHTINNHTTLATIKNTHILLNKNDEMIADLNSGVSKVKINSN